MKTKESIYIGIRADFHEVKAIYPDILWLNQSSQTYIRRAASLKGIKQTHKGKRLNFYAMDNQILKDLANPKSEFIAAIKGQEHLRPVIKITDKEVTEVYAKVNGKYPNKMSHMQYAEYKEELIAVFATKLVMISGDKDKYVAPRKNNKYGPIEAGWEVGDIIVAQSDYGQGVRSYGVIVDMTARRVIYNKINIKYQDIKAANGWKNIKRINKTKYSPTIVHLPVAANIKKIKAMVSDTRRWAVPFSGQVHQAHRIEVKKEVA